VRYDERRAEQSAGAAIGIGIACVVEPSVSNMGYITLALTPDERAAGLPKSGNAEGCIITISPLGGISVRLSTTPQGQGHRHRGRADRRRPARHRSSRGRGQRRDGHLGERVSVASGAYSSRFSGVGAGAVAAAADKLAAKIAAIREHVGEDVSLRRVAGMCHWSPESLPDGMEAGLAAVAFYSLRISSARRERPRRLVGIARLHRRRRRRRGRPGHRCRAGARLRDGARRGRLLNPLIVDGQIQGGFAHGARRRSSNA